jgi:transposase
MDEREYTNEFKEKAVRLAQLPKRSIASVAIELKIPAWKLRNWVKESKKKLERSSEIDEQIKMQRRIKELEEEVEILKKAAAYFARTLQ